MGKSPRVSVESQWAHLSLSEVSVIYEILSGLGSPPSPRWVPGWSDQHLEAASHSSLSGDFISLSLFFPMDVDWGYLTPHLQFQGMRRRPRLMPRYGPYGRLPSRSNLKLHILNASIPKQNPWLSSDWLNAWLRPSDWLLSWGPEITSARRVSNEPVTRTMVGEKLMS